MSSTPTRPRAAVVSTGGIVTGSHLPALRAHSDRIELRAAVLIGTPPSLHRAQTVAALKAGAWVLCEKPLCLSLAECDEIAAAEEAYRYRVVVADGAWDRDRVATHLKGLTW